MKKKNKSLFGVTVLAGVGIVAGIHYYRKQALERKKAQKVAEIRAEFEQMDELAAFYIYEEQASPSFLAGGAVLEDGRVFQFELAGDQLMIEEENE